MICHISKIFIMDPEKVTSRLFGGPHFMVEYTDGIFVRSLDGTKLWLYSEIIKAWNTGTYNYPPVMVSA